MTDWNSSIRPLVIIFEQFEGFSIQVLRGKYLSSETRINSAEKIETGTFVSKMKDDLFRQYQMSVIHPFTTLGMWRGVQQKVAWDMTFSKETPPNEINKKNSFHIWPTLLIKLTFLHNYIL